MRIFVLYCLFFFPLSYVIAKNGYVEQNSAKYHSLTEKDTLYIETEKTEFEILYRLCSNQQGKKNVVFELKAVDDRMNYIFVDEIQEIQDFRLAIRSLALDDTIGERAKACEEFAAALERRTGLPVTLWDERLTTVEADEVLEECGMRRENRKTVIDQLAAVFILRGYMESKQK